MIEKIFGQLINNEADADIVVEEARIVKNEAEIQKIKKAARLAKIGMKYALEKIGVIKTEID